MFQVTVEAERASANSCHKS